MKRLYSLYAVSKTGSRKIYTRVSSNRYPLSIARQVFQSQLIYSAFSDKPLELRPVRSSES